MISEQKQKPARNAARAQENSSGVVSDYPMSSVLVVFGVGIWAGVALGSLLCGSATPPTLGRRTEQVSEHLGRQLLNAIEGVLPASMAKQLSA
jgi:hypothetical protein